MHKCVVCGNKNDNTKVNRPGVIYHGFPKDPCMRRKWLKVFGIDRCYDWHRICSDHFLEKNYKPGKKRFLLSNTIPQPYGFSSNYATHSNDVETGNISPRQSSSLTRNNDDMSNKNMPGPTLRFGLRCSVKNCFNRTSKGLSFFGYPKDLTLRKLWIEKCGLKKDPADIMNSTRVCRIHFERKCFINIELKNRLQLGSVPSLFLDNAPPNALPVNEVPVLNTGEDQFISQNLKSEENKNNVKDNTDNTSTIINLTLDDSSDCSSCSSLESIEECDIMDIEDLTSDCSSCSSLESIEERDIMDTEDFTGENCDIMDTEDFTGDVHGIIFKMSSEVVLPSVYWNIDQLGAQNSIGFYQRDSSDVTVKKVIFCNNFVPSIHIYGKQYDHNNPITTTEKLNKLLEKLDNIKKCYGRRGLVFDECIGYFELDSVDMCSGCQGLVKEQDLQRFRAKNEAHNKAMESLKNIIAEKTKTVLELRRKMAEIKRKRQLDSLKPSGISNIMKS